MKYLLVGRHNNDLDFMVPIADRLADDPAHRVLYFLASPAVMPERDFRLAHLCGRANVSLHEIWDWVPGIAGRLLRRAWRGSGRPAGRPRGITRRASRSFLRGRTWDVLEGWLEGVRPDLVALDWIETFRAGPRARPPYGIGEIVRWSKRSGVPLVSLPHGLHLSDPSNARAAEYFEPFDRIYVESARRQRQLRRVLPDPLRVESVGASRYDGRWLPTLERLLPEPAAPIPPGRFVISFFPTACGPTELEPVLAWLAHLATRDGIFLVVQPHPRGQSPRLFRRLARLPSVRIDARTPAASLIRRSDAVSTLISSVVVEAVRRGKPILHPRFLHDVRTRLDAHRACLTLDDLAGTEAALRRLRAGWRPDEDHVRRFLVEEVYGGGDDEVVSRILASFDELIGRFKRPETTPARPASADPPDLRRSTARSPSSA